MLVVPIQKIDVFPHILPPVYHERLRELVPAHFRQANIIARPCLWDLDERFRIMDRYEGYVQILTLSQPPIEAVATGQLGVDMAKIANDSMAELVQRFPDRFLGFAASMMLEEVESSIMEVERAVSGLGALGAQIFTNVNGHPLDEPRFEPFFAAMARLDKPIWVHPTRTAGVPDYPSETSSKYGLYMKLGWPYETSVFMSRLIFSGIMGRYPSLRVLTHHAGGVVPHLAGRLLLHHDRADMRREIGVDEGFDEVAVTDAYRRFYGDTVFSGAHHPLMCALEFFGADHILFGTDMPFGADGGEMFVRETIASVEEVSADEAQQQQLFEQNARRILGLG